MNRRKFLATATAALLSAPALLRSVRAQERPFRVKYFPVAPGSGPRDTAAAPDGTIWYCGQRNVTVGRLDPRDGSFKQVDLGKGAAPHGVIIGPDGGRMPAGETASLAATCGAGGGDDIGLGHDCSP